MKKGFTLIELMIVIAIIGILTVIVLASLSSVRANSRDAKRLSDTAQVQLSLESYFDACKQYPPVSATVPNYLDSTVTNSMCPSGVTFGTFIPSVPKAPNAGETYIYEPQDGTGATCNAATTACKSYCLGTTLENSTNANILNQCTFKGSGISGTGNHRVKP